jgi:type III restriction enzyme
MKLQFKHQKFQADAAKAVCDVFAGQPFLTPTYMMDKGAIKGAEQLAIDEEARYTGWSNQHLVPELNDSIILEHIQRIQRSQQIKPSEKLEGRFNLTVEMETGVGKTYTYIKTMYELNKRYGWSKYIIVVPSVAIREGVYKSFQITQEHFAEEYGKKIRFFIYNSAQLTEIDRFASDSAINVMIINTQAFNATGKDARRITMKLDEFRSRRPIDILAKTNPILIIDEPQSVEGEKTKLKLKDFNPLFTLRYSATPKEYYNLIYRLDAMEAYNKKLVKKISVTGISTNGSTATESYVYLEGINLSKGNPTATIQFDFKGATGVRKITKTVGEGFKLYENSGELDEYKVGFTVKRIDGRDSSVEFINGIKLFAGDVIGKVSEDQLRRIQIRETILAHILRERQLFYKGIKVLSLFFIDEVAKYKQYGDDGKSFNGVYADMFEEEYNDVIGNMQLSLGEDEYMKYLLSIKAADTHKGYFSIDKNKKTGKERFVDSKLGDKKARTSDDADAYELIMKNKERLLDRREPVRFIFSHSALREGWDNPNVFQICTLKQSGSEVRKRQEVGRGLRLSVNQSGERMDTNLLGEDVHNVNILTVIASESYDSFAKGLQNELAEAVADRPRIVTADLFKGKVIKDNTGAEQVIDIEMAQAIYEGLIVNGYVKKGALTDKFYEDKKNNAVEVADEVKDCATDVVAIIDSIYDARAFEIENSRANNVELKIDNDKLAMPEFKKLWAQINKRSAYVVDFDTDELVKKCIAALNKDLRVSLVFFKVETGTMSDIKSKEALQSGEAFVKTKGEAKVAKMTASSSVKYDLIGKLVAETGLTRKAAVQIMTGIEPSVFAQFKDNPEEFIIKAAGIINDQKATVIIQHIAYNKLNAVYDTDIFTEPTMKGKLGVNAMKAQHHLYDHILYDSTNERDFATELDTRTEVAVYVKLPSGFFISTPVGKYNPDWAIAFKEGSVKHIYFVAETKGSMNSMQLRMIEEAKIHCAREHFKAISSDSVVYDVVDSYESLLNKVMR